VHQALQDERGRTILHLADRFMICHDYRRQNIP
jgi:hypothetical protein